MSDIHEQVEQELQQAVSNLPVTDRISEKVDQEIKKAASNIASTIEDMIESERDNAHSVCDTKGSDSRECAAAWDAVEELQAEAYHRRVKTTRAKSAFEQYCDDNPEADECRIYDD